MDQLYRWCKPVAAFLARTWNRNWVALWHLFINTPCVYATACATCWITEMLQLHLRSNEYAAESFSLAGRRHALANAFHLRAMHFSLQLHLQCLLNYARSAARVRKCSEICLLRKKCLRGKVMIWCKCIVHQEYLFITWITNKHLKNHCTIFSPLTWVSLAFITRAFKNIYSSTAFPKRE